MKGVSVIICCYNSGNKLVPTLSNLAKQQSLSGINYEIIIVDNNCTDDTIGIASETWLSLGEPFPVSIVRQPIPGLNYARDMGMQTASYEYIILCDDDNWLSDNYLIKVYHLFESMPTVALIGGVGEAVLEAHAPAWFTELEGFGYAVGTEGRKTGYVDSVYGAGMALRRSVFSAIINNDFSFLLSDRTGKDLSSGGDTEISMLVKIAGYTIYLDSSLTFKHYISSNRLQWSYYLKLRRSFGRAAAYLQLYNAALLSAKPMQRRNSFNQYLSFIKFSVWNVKYILFPLCYKNTRCADFVQQMNMRLTCLLENKKMEMLAGRIVKTLNGRRALQDADAAY